MDEDSLQSHEDIRGIDEEMDIIDTNKKDVIIRLYLKVDKLQDFIKSRWKDYSGEHEEIVDELEYIRIMISSTESPDAIMYLYGKVSKLQDFLELRWRNFPWEHEEDKVLFDGLEDIMVI